MPACIDHIGVATPSIADSLPVIASEARQSRVFVRDSGLPRVARTVGDG